MKYPTLLTIIIVCLLSTCKQEQKTYDHLPQVQFALQQIQQSIEETGESVNIRFQLLMSLSIWSRNTREEEVLFLRVSDN